MNWPLLAVATKGIPTKGIMTSEEATGEMDPTEMETKYKGTRVIPGVLNPYEKTDPKLTNASGGNAMLHYSDWILEFQPRYVKDIISTHKSLISSSVLGIISTLKIFS